MKKAIICDLDGCLSPIEGRIEYLKNKDWDKFHASGSQIDAAQWCIEILKRFSPDYQVLFITGRPDNYFSETLDWIKNQTGLDSFELFMNAPYNPKTFVHDYDFKITLYLNKIKSNYDILFVIDDRPTVVDAWRGQGLMVLQPNFISH